MLTEILQIALLAQAIFLGQNGLNGNFTPVVLTPVISPSSGTYTSPQTITITDATPGATLCYTTDGSTPTGSSGSCTHGTTYSGGFSQALPVTVKALGTLASYINSSIASNTYTLGHTFTAASCNQTDVQSAVTSEQSSPLDGDIISIPVGTCTWTGTTGIAQSFSNSVTIQGAGAESSTSGGGGPVGTDQTEIIDNISGTPDVAFTTVAGKSLRFTGIALVQNGSSTRGANNGMLQILGASTAIQVDHCHFYTINGGVGFRIDGAIQGVSNFDYYESPSSSVTNDLAIHNGETWQGDTAGNGDKSWTDTDHFGSSEFFFVEDCRFYNGYVLDAHDGARYVFRYNTVTGDGSSAQQVTGHGLTDARGRAVRTVELYQNTFSTPTAIGNPTFSLNSGALLFWGNTISQYKGAIEADYTRKSNATYTYLAPPNGWGYCGTAFGPANWDENLDSTGYPCLDAAGRGAGDLLTGNFPTVCDSTTGCTTYTGTWPHQALDSVYVWDNAYTLPYASVNLIVVDASMYQDNRDYYQQFGTYGEPGSFNGTKGVGQGLFSAITSTCTLGVGYWATDQTALYVCNPANTWRVYYTPYTYPHP